MSPRLVLPAALLALAFIPTAYADTTLRHRIEPSGGVGYQPLTSVKGEKLRRAPGRRGEGPRSAYAPPPVARAVRPAHRPADRRRDVARRASTSPIRRAARSSRRGARRRRSACRCSTASSARSTPTGAARSSRATASAPSSAFALTTGDLADNQQLNETRWFRTVLDGGHGRPVLGQGDRQLQRVHRRDDRRDRVDQRRRGGAPLHRRRRLRRLRVGARRPQGRLLGSRRGGAGRRPVRRVPALSRAARARAGPVPGGRA